MVSTETIGSGIRIIDSQNEKEIKSLADKSRNYNIKNHRDAMLKIYITRLMLSVSGVWLPDKDNTDRLSRVGDDKARKAVAKTIMKWMLDATPAAEYAYIKNALLNSEICTEITREIDIQINRIVESFII
jgi:hypothetical protein